MFELGKQQARRDIFTKKIPNVKNPGMLDWPRSENAGA